MVLQNYIKFIVQDCIPALICFLMQQEKTMRQEEKQSENQFIDDLCTKKVVLIQKLWNKTKRFCSPISHILRECGVTVGKNEDVTHTGPCHRHVTLSRGLVRCTRSRPARCVCVTSTFAVPCRPHTQSVSEHRIPAHLVVLSFGKNGCLAILLSRKMQIVQNEKLYFSTKDMQLIGTCIKLYTFKPCQLLKLKSYSGRSCKLYQQNIKC